VPDPAPDRSPQFDDELLGLDPADPEAQAFAAHLDRMQRQRPAFTVEGYLDGVRDFADSANRAEGGRRRAAVLLVGLLLAVVLYLVGDALLFVLSTWL
jgi:Na+/citrate or Na+/malate symporter